MYCASNHVSAEPIVFVGPVEEFTSTHPRSKNRPGHVHVTLRTPVVNAAAPPIPTTQIAFGTAPSAGTVP